MEQLSNGFTLASAPDVFPLCADTVLLSHFAAVRPRDRVLDLGCGGGYLSMLLIARQPDLTVLCLDSSGSACALARENAARNGLSAAVAVLEGDLRAHQSLLSPGAFDLTVSNPPYFPPGGGPAAAGARAQARGGATCTVDDLCAAAAWATRFGGRFSLVFRPERLAELFCALDRHGFAPKRLQPVRHSPGDPVSLLLVEARRGGGPGLRWEPDLTLYGEDDTPSEAMRHIYHL